MAGKVLNIKARSPLKLHSGLTGNYYAICHYSYNLPLATSNEGIDKPNETQKQFLMKISKSLTSSSDKIELYSNLDRIADEIEKSIKVYRELNEKIFTSKQKKRVLTKFNVDFNEFERLYEILRSIALEDVKKLQTNYIKKT